MNKIRKKVPSDVEAQIFYKSRMLCYCGERGDQIHHIDGEPSNYDIDNLIFLCRPHHDDAEIRNGIGKGKINLARKIPSQKQFKILRDKLYRDNDIKRRLEHQNFVDSLKTIKDENLFKAAMEANIVIEILKVKHDYRENRKWDRRDEIIHGLGIFKDYKSSRAAFEVFEVLHDFASTTRSGMSAHTAEYIEELIVSYFPSPEEDQKVVAELGEKCTLIGWAIAYDSFIHLENLATGSAGLKILSFIYRVGKNRNIPALAERALHWYDEIQRTLVRPECGDDLDLAQEVTKLYRANVHREEYSDYHMDRKLGDLILSHYLEVHPKRNK